MRSESDTRSYEATIRGCKESPEKILRLQQDSNLWPQWYWCINMFHQLSYESWLGVGQDCLHRPLYAVIKCTKCRVYHLYALQIANTSESDPHSCEATTAVAKKAQKKIMWLQRDSNPWPPWYQCDALPTELWSLVGSRSGARSIYTRYMKRVRWCANDKDHINAMQIKNTSESDPRRSIQKTILALFVRCSSSSFIASSALISLILSAVFCGENWETKHSGIYGPPLLKWWNWNVN